MKKNHVALLFFVIASLSCNRKKEIPKADNRKTVPDVIRKNPETRKLDIPKKIHKGFVVLTKDNDGTVTLYNEDSSVWQSFLLDDYPSLTALDPFILKPEDTLIAFELTGKEGDFYKVIVDKEKKLAKYIKVSDRNFKFETVPEYIMNVFCVGFDKSKNPLRAGPNDSSRTFAVNEDYFYCPKKIQGDRLMVEDNDGNLFWIKWCDEKGNLILELYHDA